MSERDRSWRVTSVSLSNRSIQINQNKYHFGRHTLGSGAFGTVYPAKRVNDGSEVAIKVISLSTGSGSEYLADSFLNEVKQSKRLSAESKHIVQIFDFDFHSNGLAFLVMERGGIDLEKTLRDKDTLPIPQQQHLWRQILNILITLHRNSIVHVDLKPSNLVFFAHRLKLVDLGIAQKANSRGRGPAGTYGFSAPEVRFVSMDAYPRFTPRADTWSVGAILYWMNYGDSPEYDPNNRCYRPPRGIPSVKDRNLVDVLRHTLHMDPSQRPSTTWLAQHPFTRSM